MREGLRVFYLQLERIKLGVGVGGRGDSIQGNQCWERWQRRVPEAPAARTLPTFSEEVASADLAWLSVIPWQSQRWRAAHALLIDEDSCWQSTAFAISVIMAVFFPFSE